MIKLTPEKIKDTLKQHSVNSKVTTEEYDLVVARLIAQEQLRVVLECLEEATGAETYEEQLDRVDAIIRAIRQALRKEAGL